ncbi:class F sortase [Streptomyces genisteinicus]|uniref:Class F sortase n=1 Tax=Streptomyces genisteinicus TaxID=2768068 RepID=A0A7H0I393_9ACTN|nr:class F sortase [Streptomyces genisteinicus]
MTGLVHACDGTSADGAGATVAVAAAAPARIELPPLTKRVEAPPARRTPAPRASPVPSRTAKPASSPSPAGARRKESTPRPASRDGKARGVQPLPPSPAKRLVIPKLTITSPVTLLGLDARGTLTAPPVDEPKLVGWYGMGPAPGEAGTAVAVGHRDTRTGPAVFLNLSRLKPGDTVDVVREDRRTAVFTVDKVRTFTKDEFPDKQVYGSTGRPELRLLTCGGSFDKKRGYSANVVVFAHLTDVRRV